MSRGDRRGEGRGGERKKMERIEKGYKMIIKLSADKKGRSRS